MPSVTEWRVAEVLLPSSDYDLWSQPGVAGMPGAVCLAGNNRRLSGAVVAEVDQFAFAPHVALKCNWWPTG